MLMFKFPDGTEHDFDALPEASRQGGVQRFINHVFGNEVASQVVGKIKSTLAGSNGKADSVTTEQVKAYRTANAEAVRTWTLEFQAEKKAAIINGQLGIRASSGIVIDPLTREMTAIATAELRVLLEKHGLKLPTKDGTILVRGQPKSRADLVSAHMAKNHDRIEREAKAKLAADARKAKAVAEGAGDDLAESLGL